MMSIRWKSVLWAGLVLAATDLVSVAAAQTSTTSAPAVSEKAYDFALPYRIGTGCLYRQALQLEARTGEYGPHDLVMDIRQIVTYSITRTAEDAVSVRVMRFQQRGDMQGQRMRRDESGARKIQETRSHDDDWRFRATFRAQMDASGKFTNVRGTADIDQYQPAAYRNHVAITSGHARRDDWVRQLAEEPTLYLPAGKPQVGDTWTHRRTLRNVGGLSIFPAESLAETIVCKLVSVQESPQGPLATIDVCSTTGEDKPGETWLRKTGQVCCALNDGALIKHNMTLSGRFKRANNLRPVAIRGTLNVSPCPAASPAATRSSLPAIAADLPAWERDGHVVFVHDPGTKLIPDPQGKIWALVPTPGNPEAAAKHRQRTYPVEIADPRRDVPGELPALWHLPMLADPLGRVWWHGVGLLHWVEGGRYQTHQFAGHYGQERPPFSMVHGITGHDLFFESNGNVLASGEKALQIRSAGAWRSVSLPSRIGSNVPMSQQQDFLFRRIGNAVYIARNFGPANHDAKCSLLVWENGVLCDMGVLVSQQAWFLGEHKGELLVGTTNGLWRLVRFAPAAADQSQLTAAIEQLTANDYAVREAARARIEQAGPAGVEILQKAIAREPDAERKLWFTTALGKITVKPSAELVPTQLDGDAVLEFVFQTRDGKQFYRPVDPSTLEPRDYWICLTGAPDIRRIKLPRAGGLAAIHCETPDGRKVIGRDAACVFELDLQTLVIRDMFSLRGLATNGTPQVLAVKDGLYCLAISRPGPSWESPLYVWYNPATKAKDTMLPGVIIAEGVSPDTNYDPDLAIAPGRDGRLWMLRQTNPPQNQLAYAEGLKVTTLAPLVPGGKAAVLPLEQRAALVLPQSGYLPAVLHTGEQTFQRQRLRDLISLNFDQMIKLVPEGVPYRVSSRGDHHYLLRLGRNFWLRESTVEFVRNGTTTVDFCGYYAGGDWKEFALGREVGVDAQRQRLLMFDGECRKLAWASIEDGQPKLEAITQRDFSFGWCWYDLAGLPYQRSAMVLTDEAIGHLQDKFRRPEADDKATAADFTGFRRWNGSAWVTWRGTLWGGNVYTDEIGSIWHLRTRDVLIQLPDGRRQRLELDDALRIDSAHLSSEKAGVVWLATDESVLRLVSEQEGGKYGPYRIDRRFSTRHRGYAVRGPWVIGGKHLYYASGGKLYYVALEELLGPSTGPVTAPAP